MKELSVAGHDIEPYLPRRMPARNKEIAADTARKVVESIERLRPIGIRYNGTERLLHPYSSYLQSSTLRKGMQIPAPDKVQGAPWEHRSYMLGARDAVGIDGYQVHALGGLHRGWRTFHLDRIDDFELLSDAEMVEIFLSEDPSRAELAAWERYMEHEFRPLSRDFARHHRHENRLYLAQVSAGREKLPRLRK